MKEINVYAKRTKGGNVLESGRVGEILEQNSSRDDILMIKYIPSRTKGVFERAEGSERYLTEVN